jgi:hypothetical protein
MKAAVFIHLRGAFIQGAFKWRTPDCVQRRDEPFGAGVTHEGEISCSSRKFWASLPLARCSRSPRRQTPCRSAIPAPQQPFRKMPGWRRPKFIGGIITTIGGTAGIIATITTIIIATGIAGDATVRRSHRTGPFIAGLF